MEKKALDRVGCLAALDRALSGAIQQKTGTTSLLQVERSGREMTFLGIIFTHEVLEALRIDDKKMGGEAKRSKFPNVEIYCGVGD